MDNATAVERVGSIAQRLAEKPYEKRVCRSENYPILGAKNGTGLSLEAYTDLMDRVGLEVQIISIEHDRGTPRFASKMLPPTPDLDPQLIPKFLRLAHEKGIIVLGYYPMTYTKPLKTLHPEWLIQFLDDGRPKPENLGWFCFNSPYRDWLPQYLIEFLDNLDLDGFYFDDMNWGSHEERPYHTGCCCEYCRLQFKEDTGRQIPTKIDFDSVDFRHFVNWRYDKLRDYLAHVTQAVKKTHPSAILDFNHYPEQARWSWAHPLNPLRLEEVGAHFLVLTGFTMRENRCGFIAKVAQAHGSAFALWRPPMQALTECSWGAPPHAEPLSPTMHGLTSMAHGGAATYGMWENFLPQLEEFIRSIFAELKKRTEYMHGETVKYVALHYSQQANDFLPAEATEQTEDAWLLRNKYVFSSYAKGIKGTCDMLTQSHLLTDILFDEQLTGQRLSLYRVLFLSNSACLSGQQCDAIRAFVKQGGTLIATHETSLRDELGQRRDSFGLADVLGVDYVGAAENGPLHGVVYVPHDESLSREFGHIICFAGQESMVTLRAGTRVNVLCTRSSLAGSRPMDRLDLKGSFDSQQPAVTVHGFGQGRAIYISGNLGRGYSHNPYPALKRFVANLVARTPPPIAVAAPKAIEVTATIGHDGQLMVHLLNNPTPSPPFDTPMEEISTYFYLEEVNPIHDITITVHDWQVRRAEMPLSGISLPVHGSPSTITVPEVALHEVVVMELAT